VSPAPPDVLPLVPLLSQGSLFEKAKAALQPVVVRDSPGRTRSVAASRPYGRRWQAGRMQLLLRRRPGGRSGSASTIRRTVWCGRNCRSVGAELVVPEKYSRAGRRRDVVGPGFVDLTATCTDRRAAAAGTGRVTHALDLEAADAIGPPTPRRPRRTSAALRLLGVVGAARRRCCSASTGRTASQRAGSAGRSGWQRSSSQPSCPMADVAGATSPTAPGIGVLMGYAPRAEPAEFVRCRPAGSSCEAPDVHARPGAGRGRPAHRSTLGGDRDRRRGDRCGMHHCHVNARRAHVGPGMALLERAPARVADHRRGLPVRTGSTASERSFSLRNASGLGHIAVEQHAGRDWRAHRRRGAAARGARRDARGGVHRRSSSTSAPATRRCAARASVPDSIVASDAMPVLLGRRRDGSRDWPLPPGGGPIRARTGTFAKTSMDGPRVGTGRGSRRSAASYCRLGCSTTWRRRTGQATSRRRRGRDWSFSIRTALPTRHLAATRPPVRRSAATCLVAGPRRP